MDLLKWRQKIIQKLPRNRTTKVLMGIFLSTTRNLSPYESSKSWWDNNNFVGDISDESTISLGKAN